MLELTNSEVRIAARCVGLHLQNLDSVTQKTLFKDEAELLDKLMDYQEEVALAADEYAEAWNPLLEFDPEERKHAPNSARDC